MVTIASNNSNSSPKSVALAAALGQIEKQFGKGAVQSLGGEATTNNLDIVSTGSPKLDKALGVGGLARGRIHEIFGPESSGKSTLALEVIAEAQKKESICAFIDVEHALDPGYAKLIGVNSEELYVSQPNSAEEALSIAETLALSGAVDIIVIDSVAAMCPKMELEGEMGAASMGLHSRLMSQACRKLTGILKKTNTMAIFINQIRFKIGGFGNPETTTGGNALKFYATTRIDIRRTGSYKVTDCTMGNETRIKVVKNKLAPPFKQAETKILFGKGFDYYGEVLDLGLDARIIDKRGTWYLYKNLKLGQGRLSATEALENDKVLLEEILSRIN
ncbi:recombinase RecA [Vibrio antiquarius]|uniref:recombinase RecA n=1 Tax=Vibrio antiquarius (strain Ex25) TaxID=150340 RepID=UPI00265ACA74|nr:recombinase RecA [Vibrio antiquarius]MCR9911393.1 recombinase RecA [Vibrio antiquarius]